MYLLILNVAMQTNLGDTERSCWAFMLQKSSWRLKLNIIVHICATSILHIVSYPHQHIPIPDTSFLKKNTMRKKTAINTSPMMLTTIPAMVPDDRAVELDRQQYKGQLPNFMKSYYTLTVVNQGFHHHNVCRLHLQQWLCLQQFLLGVLRSDQDPVSQLRHLSWLVGSKFQMILPYYSA